MPFRPQRLSDGHTAANTELFATTCCFVNVVSAWLSCTILICEHSGSIAPMPVGVVVN